MAIEGIVTLIRDGKIEFKNRKTIFTGKNVVKYTREALTIDKFDFKQNDKKLPMLMGGAFLINPSFIYEAILEENMDKTEPQNMFFVMAKMICQFSDDLTLTQRVQRQEKNQLSIVRKAIGNDLKEQRRQDLLDQLKQKSRLKVSALTDQTLKDKVDLTFDTKLDEKLTSLNKFVNANDNPTRTRIALGSFRKVTSILSSLRPYFVDDPLFKRRSAQSLNKEIDYNWLESDNYKIEEETSEA